MGITARLLCSVSLAGAALLATAAHAFDPNAGADAPGITAPAARYRPLPSGIVPSRYYTPGSVPGAAAAPVYQAAVIAPPAPPVATGAVISPPPPPPQAYVQQPYATPAYAPAAYAAAVAPTGYVARSTYDANRFAIGIEGFYDHYEEPDTFPDLNTNAYYGSVDIAYEHYFTPNYYAAFDGRASRGSDRYKSSQGSISDVPQWEFDPRLLIGYDSNYGGSHVKPYIGIGSRYYLDQSKGKFTTGGNPAYERRIFQLYIPIGVTYEFKAYGFNFAPNVEIDPLIYGNVQSRLQNISGFGLEEINNRQKSGIGLRAEFLVGQLYPNGLGWQFGPFVRYWNVPDSETDTNGSIAPSVGFEPKNTRVQVGAKLKFLF